MASLFAGLLLCASACGDGGGPIAPPPDDTGGGGEQGGSGGGGDAGGSGGGDQGGSGGGDQGGSAGGDQGGSGGGGGGATSCAGLTATPGAARALRFGTGTHGACTRGTSAPNGQIALGTVHYGGGDVYSFTLYPSDGSAEQGRLSGLISPRVADLDPWFHWTSAGWTGLWRSAPAGPPSLGWFDASGNLIRTTEYTVVATAPDGHGGSVALAHDAWSDPPPPTRLEWLDAYGSVIRRVVLDDRPSMLLVSWQTGHVLTFVRPFDGRAPRARWYDGTGTPLTPWFDAGPALDEPTIHLLLDGTIALGDVNGWRGVFRDGVAAVDAPPAWLAARPGTRLASIRGGRGYAVLPYANGASGAGPLSELSFEILTADGESCGTVRLPAARAEAGVTRSPMSLDVGQDGTVIAREALGGEPLGWGIHCEYRWWSALLQ